MTIIDDKLDDLVYELVQEITGYDASKIARHVAEPGGTEESLATSETFDLVTITVRKAYELGKADR